MHKAKVSLQVGKCKLQWQAWALGNRSEILAWVLIIEGRQIKGKYLPKGMLSIMNMRSNKVKSRLITGLLYLLKCLIPHHPLQHPS